MTHKLIGTSFFWALCFMVVSGSSIRAQDPGSATVTYQTFYDNLSPYGTWIDYPNYGHVWNPRVEGDFRPYNTNGRWISSQEGWTWASDYNWGWAPFHYGRWLYDDLYGWLWIPGYEWSPAWVTWGTVDNYYCWAPLMPGIDGIRQYDTWRPHSFYWNACSRDHIYDRNLSAVIERPERVSNFANRISIVNNFTTTRNHNLYYSKGPEVQEVQKYVSRKIDQAPLKEIQKMSPTMAKDNPMKVYRPAIQPPEETRQQFPQQSLQPQEFRKAETSKLRPIMTEEQIPTMQHTEQRANIERLPAFHAEAGNFRNSGGGGGRRSN
ncbi:DUF6600 domain-containing protein [Flavobacterium kingsejongi]|uniref:Uncharacterized protein n=1 Tax=Flavobacterium kingsejongi TaxID=1678728 RepID=A0A2S1LPU6_9FLAO|nr:DUF6600 domain-containing protein [Flavobacterium kingsejongi]AWG25775.1 hypothetical protein FK004_11355 [Flavobacterium kingsejongi]